MIIISKAVELINADETDNEIETINNKIMMY